MVWWASLAVPESPHELLGKRACDATGLRGGLSTGSWNLPLQAQGEAIENFLLLFIYFLSEILKSAISCTFPS